MRPPLIEDPSLARFGSSSARAPPKQRPLTQFLGQAFGCGCIRRPKAKTWPLEVEQQEGSPLAGSPYGGESIRELEYPVDAQRSGPQRSLGSCPWPTPWLLGLAAVATAIVVLLLAAGASAAGVKVWGGGTTTTPPIATGDSRVRITNGCSSEPMWVSHIGAAGHGPQNLRIAPLAFYDFAVPDHGMPQTRYWTKWRCAEGGAACGIGDSGGPDQTCDRTAGCAPPIDTKFEAIFGVKGESCNTAAQEFSGCDFVDVSVKDGYTVPFELEIKGDCRGSSAAGTEKIHQVVACAHLSPENCPVHEDLGEAGSDLDLRAVNPVWGTYAGCYSPCSKLTYGAWAGRENATQRQVPTKDTGGKHAPYCCPSGQDCRGGPIERTAFVRGVRAACPGVNSYAYDHGLAVGTCPAGTRYEMIFYCPPARKDHSADG